MRWNLFSSQPIVSSSKMSRRCLPILLFFVCSALLRCYGQSPDSTQLVNRQLDSLYIHEVEDQRTPNKVLHAEPLFIDLIRDLGARKGEREWNVGLGLTDNFRYDTYTALVEYEWAPVNRLGLEVELPFSFYTRNEPNGEKPANQLESLKTAVQWSFYVSERRQTTLAVGYINELHLRAFGRANRGPAVRGNTSNPFFIAAKRWGNRFHTLVYAGPLLERSVEQSKRETHWQINTNLHYMIPGSRNFIGVELNKELAHHRFQLVARPQLRVSVTDKLLVGIVTGIPIDKQSQRLSTFMRLICEPGHRSKAAIKG